MDLVKSTKSNIQSRYDTIAHDTVARLVYLLEQTGIPSLAQPHSSDYCTIPAQITAIPPLFQYIPLPKVSLHLGVNLISSIHSKPSRIIQIKHWKWWSKKYWQPNRLSDELESEIRNMENTIQEIGKSLKQTQKNVKHFEGEVRMYQGHLSASRETMIAIGTKTRQYVDETFHTKHAKVRISFLFL